MKDINSFIVIHYYRFAIPFVKQDIFETSSSKKTLKKPGFSCFFLIVIIYLAKKKKKLNQHAFTLKSCKNRCLFSIYKYITF